MLRNQGERLTRVVVCTPQTEYFRVTNLKVHNIAEIANPEKAREQHDHLKAILKKFGCEVIDIQELAGHPNSVFTWDTALSTPQGYIKLRMGLRTRRGEEEWMAKALDSVGEPQAGSIEEPGTAEGGDIILAGRVAFIGQTQRTNASGVKQLSRLLTAMNYEVRSITMPKSQLHLGSAMSLIGPDHLLCCRGVFPDEFLDGFDRIEISCNAFSSANVVCLGDNKLIAHSANTVAIKELKKAGMVVHTVDLSEFAKGRGGPTCLILPVERK